MIPPRLSEALKHVPTQHHQYIRTTHAKRTFSTILGKLTEGKPIENKQFRRIVDTVWKRVISKDIRVEPKPNMNMPMSVEEQRAYSFFTTQPVVVFGNGARATIEIRMGRNLFETLNLERAIRVYVKPIYDESLSKNREWFKSFQTKQLQDVSKSAINSIVYLGASIEHVEGKGMVLIVWVRQMRLLQEAPRDIQKRYAKWDIEALRVLEQMAKQAGVRQIAIASQEMHDESDDYWHTFFEDNRGAARERLKIQYDTFWTRCARNGYEPEKMSNPNEAVDGNPRRFRRSTFLLKKI